LAISRYWLKKLFSDKLNALFVPKPMAAQFFAKPWRIWKAARLGGFSFLGGGILFPNYSRQS
jgi:hypothetical protein